MTGTAPARRPRRLVLIVLAVLGAGLIAAPVVFQMFDRAPKGARMISEFAPFMTAERLDGYQREIAQIDAGVREANTAAPAILARDSADPQGTFAERFPGVVDFERQWGPVEADMTDLLDTIQANRGNYRAVAALPSFELFPWFFVIPGALLLGLGLAALARPSWWTGVRWALVVLGVGLILAPVVFRMFERAPAGGRMMTAFSAIETREKVETIQGYFGTIAVGEGAIRLQLVPALHRAGLSDGEIAERLPAVAALEREWIPILNDLTPMIGVMSDNVDNYDAVAALPPFALFPWFFVLPGLLVVALSALATARLGSGTRTADTSLADQPISQGER